MRKLDRIAEASDLLGKLSPPILVVLGITLAGLFFWKSEPANISEFSSLADIILKLMAIAIAGVILPRLAGFKIGGAEFSLKDEGQEFGKTMNELSHRISAIEASCNATKRSESPAATAIVEYPEPKLKPKRNARDIQKGRFGKSPTADNFEVSASFPTASTTSKVQKVVLEVHKTDDSNVRLPVRFYLHDSFGREYVDVQPIDGKATLELLAWGGFTVGVWPKETENTLLELDLAEIDYAPKVIKEL